MDGEASAEVSLSLKDEQDETAALTEQDQNENVLVTVQKYEETQPAQLPANNSIQESQEGIEIIDICEDENNKNSEAVISGEQAIGSVPGFWSSTMLELSRPPVQVTGDWSDFSSTKSLSPNFTKGCKWSPDGYYLVSCSEDNILRLFVLPEVLYREDADWSGVHEMKSLVTMKEGGLVYDYCWYPLMETSNPDTCCIATTYRHGPVHLWDAFTGELRCSYKPYNHLDEVETANSIAFDSAGQKVFCGFHKYIKVFDVDRPGRNCTQIATKTSGHVGIVSCITANPVIPDLYAAGTYLRGVGVYSQSSAGLAFLLQGQRGGVTHLEFSPDGQTLYSGGRKDPEILCWDLRNPGTVLYSLRREVTTNQRIYFQLDRNGNYLASGNTNGYVTLWNLNGTQPLVDDEGTVLPPVFSFPAHNDCVNGVSVHPVLPVLATCSGQRHYPELSEVEEEMFTSRNITVDNSLRLWWLGHVNSS